MEILLKSWALGFCALLVSEAIARADAPAGRYVVSNGTVTDNKTKLVWQQSISGSAYTRAEALAYCPTLGSGWRLPTAKELITLIDFSKADDGSTPLVSSGLFPAKDWSYTGGAYYFWSSTGDDTSGTWAVNFKHDFYLLARLVSDTTTYVRCVR